MNMIEPIGMKKTNNFMEKNNNEMKKMLQIVEKFENELIQSKRNVWLLK